MISPLLESAVDDNDLFFSAQGLSQKVILTQKEEIRGIFSRIEIVEDGLSVMASEMFQSQVTVPTKSLPPWFNNDTSIQVEDGTGVLHEYSIEKMQEDSMLARMHIWLKDIGSREVPT